MIQIQIKIKPLKLFCISTLPVPHKINYFFACVKSDFQNCLYPYSI